MRLPAERRETVVLMLPSARHEDRPGREPRDGLSAHGVSSSKAKISSMLVSRRARIESSGAMPTQGQEGVHSFEGLRQINRLRQRPPSGVTQATHCPSRE
jgi:hypothetical protein